MVMVMVKEIVMVIEKKIVMVIENEIVMVIGYRKSNCHGHWS